VAVVVSLFVTVIVFLVVAVWPEYLAGGEAEEVVACVAHQRDGGFK
jgi:hypothetical protein